jgi:hypothetical protein
MKRKKNKESSLLLILPYYGTFPSYSNLFFKSCEKNSSINWLLITDQDTSNIEIPENVRIKKIEFKDLIFHAKSKLGIKIVAPKPYKLCDLKPAYGVIFDKEIKDYDFWGHCDMDLIFGNIRRFLTKNLFEKYNKLLICGHLSIYRNCEAANNYFKLKLPNLDYKKVFSSPRNFWFDEWKGIALILRHYRIPFYIEDIFADIDTRYDDMRTRRGKNYKEQVFSYDEGSVYKEFWDGNKFDKKEYAYIHLQKRKFNRPIFNIEEKPLRYFITSKGFILRKNDILSIDDMKRLNSRPKLLRRTIHSTKMLFKRVKSHL